MAGQKDTVITRQIPPPHPIVPLDEDGNPLARVGIQISELIGLPKYSNITVGPILLERWCKNTPEERRHALNEIMAEVAQIAGEYRTAILESLRRAGVDI